MPGKVRVKILAGRNLPIMDRSSDTTDAYVEIKLGSITCKTDVYRKSLHPQWNSDWFRFEVDDEELQDEPLQLRLMDHDTYSANDAIGKVNISLNPLLLPNLDASIQPDQSGKGSVMSGWIPVFDTMHGIRGELNLIVKVDYFSDVNKFRQSSCGVHFFHSPIIPHGYHAQVIHGFVEELVVNDDPEYQWIDKIRTPRASNEARQVVFLRLSSQVQRKIGLKAIDLGANAVIGYTQCFDLEGDVGVVARGIGTAVTLVKCFETVQSPAPETVAIIEEQTKQYLDFLSTKKNEVEFDVNAKPFSFDGGDVVYKILGIDEEDGKKPSSIILNQKNNSVKDGTDGTVPVETLKEELQDFKSLISQEDLRGNEPKTGLLNKMKKFKNSSKNLLNIGSSKPQVQEELQSEADPSDFYEYTPVRTAKSVASEIKDMFKSGFKRSPSQRDCAAGTGMTTLLVRTIMASPQPIPITDDTATGGQSKIDAHNNAHNNAHGLANMPTTIMASEGNLSSKLTDSTYSMTSSSEDVEQISDAETNDVVLIDADTVSMVVKSVLAQEEAEHDEYSWIQPSKNQNSDDDEAIINPQQTEKLLPQKKHRHVKRNASFHGTGLTRDDLRKSIRTGATHIVVPNKKGTRMETYLLEKDADDRLLDSILSVNVNDSQEDNWIQPGSTVDEPEFDDAPQGSLFHDIKENISEKLHNLQEHIYHPHHHGEIKHKHGLLATAMDTMLIEQAELFGAQMDMSPKLNELLKEEKRTHSYDSFKKILHSPFRNRVNSHDHKKRNLKNSGLVDTAMKTMLIETANIIEGVGIHPDDDPRTSKHIPKPFARKNTVDQSDVDEKVLLTLNEGIQQVSARINNANKFETASVIIKKPTTSDKPDEVTSALPLTTSSSSSDSINRKNQAKMPAVVSDQCSNQISVQSHSPKKEHIASSQHNLHHHSYHQHHHRHHIISSHSPHDPNHQTPKELCVNPFKFYDISNNPNQNRNNNNNSINQPNSNDSNDNHKTNKRLLLAPNSSSLTRKSNSSLHGYTRNNSTGSKESQSPIKVTPVGGHLLTAPTKDPVARRSSDSELCITPKGSSLACDRQTSGIFRSSGTPNLKTPLNLENLDMLEYPFLTLMKYPPGFIVQFGTAVCARSVKLLEKVPNQEEPETRDSWWMELRMEIRSHARSLGCNVVLGYTEMTSICDDACVLSAMGTAAVINHQYTISDKINSALKDNELDIMKDLKGLKKRPEHEGNDTEVSGGVKGCTLCHMSFGKLGINVTGKMKRCAVCKKGKVPDILLTTVEIPDNLDIIGRGCLIHAQACHWKKDLKSEANAKEISDGLPFLEYDLQRLMVNKLKAKGMNAIFGLKITVSIGEKMMALVGTGTGVFLPALPSPRPPKIVQGNMWTNTEKIQELNRSVKEAVYRNRQIYQLKYDDVDEPAADTEDSEEETKEVEVPARTKDICILEIDDIEDLEIISLILEPGAPEGFHVVNTQTVPGLLDLEVARNLQMFSQVWRAKFGNNQKVNTFPKHFIRLLQTIYFKLRSMIPCAICDLKFRLDLPESDEFQIFVTGIALGLKKPPRQLSNITNVPGEDELIFKLEEEHSTDLRGATTGLSPQNALKRYGVDITPLTYVPGGRINKYLGNLNFFFIRESTSIRENGGISGFVHSFITELLAVVRAHITALGGNAMVSFYMSELILGDNPHKNQGQTIISVGGDVVSVEYFADS